MNEITKKNCRFCLNTVYDCEFYVTDEITNQMLTALLNLNLHVDKGTVMCTECATKLRNAYDFKSTCVNIERNILPFFSSEENMKLNEVNLRGNENVELIDGSEGHKICRFCMKVTESGCYTFLQEEKEYVFILDVLLKYVPEMHLSDSEEIVTCEACLISLQNLSGFITDYLDVRANTQNMEETIESQLKLSEEKLFELKHEINDINIAMEEKYDEEITVKVEDVLELGNSELPIKNDEIKSFQDTACSSHLNLNSMEIYKATFEEREQACQNVSEVKMYKCEKCLFETNCKYQLKQHKLIHKNISEKIYKCKTCSHQTKFKNSLKRHMLIHQDLSDVPVYVCEMCSYQTKYKNNLKKHTLVHLDFSDVTVYNCESCSYQTKLKNSLKKHLLIHQSPSDVTAYKCETCSFETKFKHSLKNHMLIHQNPLVVTLYKCETCLFQTKFKGSLKKHVLIHQKLSVFKCKKCLYETKLKYCLKNHMLMHHGPPDITVYNCETCSYQTKFKHSLKRHMLLHKDISDVPVYKCTICPYQTKFQNNHKMHMVIHQDPSDVTLYKCETCPFQTKFKRNLKKHKLRHLSNVTMYKCEKCMYQTKFERYLKRHMLTTHRDISKVTMSQ